MWMSQEDKMKSKTKLTIQKNWEEAEWIQYTFKNDNVLTEETGKHRTEKIV